MFTSIVSRFFHSVDSITKGLVKALDRLDAVAEREYSKADAKRATAQELHMQAREHEQHADRAQRIGARIEDLLK